MEYYLRSDNGQRIGPLKESDLPKYHISKSTLIWREGFKDWITISELPESKRILSKLPPPIESSWGCGTELLIWILAIPIAFFIPFLWIIVFLLTALIIRKIFRS
jgi:hypothetical protein